MASKRHSIFGSYYFKQPRAVRARILRQLEDRGISPMTTRQWMYSANPPRVPREKYHKAIEKVTEQKIEILFPY